MHTLPKFSQFLQINKVFSRRELIVFFAFASLAFASLVFLVANGYLQNTVSVPASGGTYREGVVGQPRFINPIYASTSDIDRAITNLAYSGLMTYNGQGQVVNDLAESYTISPDGKTYDFLLHNNAVWNDGQPVTADDVVFTVKAIQNSDYKSPLRANWVGVVVEKTGDYSVRFTLQNPYRPFLETCTLKILPQHIWQDIPAQGASLSSYNLQPVGSGPFTVNSVSRNTTGLITSMQLQANPHYYLQSPYLSGITFQFFANAADLATAANAGKIDGFSLDPFGQSATAADREIHARLLGGRRFTQYSFSVPHYFAAFFNESPDGQKSPIFSDPNVRKALSYAVDTQALTDQINRETGNGATVVSSPVLSDFYGYPQPTATYSYDPTQAGALLDQAGFISQAQGPRTKAINKTPAVRFNSYLQIGSSGSQVSQLQQCLKELDPSFSSLLANDTPGKYTSATGNAITAFQQKYLPSLKPTGETGVSTRAKLNELCTAQTAPSQPLSFTITTADQPQLVETANFLKDAWQKAGAEVSIKTLSLNDLQQVIKNRDYEVLVYGQALGSDPDPYPFWHSSQIVDPGLNLSGYQNTSADQLLEQARQATQGDSQAQDYAKLQDTLISDAPALFLYDPAYLYRVSPSIKGITTKKIIDPAGRFADVTSWYMKTKRVWK